MNRQFIQVTNGLLPVAVLALLAVAFIAGQARANLTGDSGIEAVPAAGIVIGADMLRNAESLPVLVDALTALPSGIEIQVRLIGDMSVSSDLRNSSPAHP